MFRHALTFVLISVTCNIFMKSDFTVFSTNSATIICEHCSLYVNVCRFDKMMFMHGLRRKKLRFFKTIKEKIKTLK